MFTHPSTAATAVPQGAILAGWFVICALLGCDGCVWASDNAEAEATGPHVLVDPAGPGDRPTLDAPHSIDTGDDPDAGAESDAPSDGGDVAAGEVGPAAGGVIDGPLGLWTWYDIRGSVCANGTPTGIGVSQGSGSQVLIYMSSGSACLDELCSSGTPSMRRNGGFRDAELGACVTGVCDGGVPFPKTSIFDRTAAANPFTDATYVFISNCSGDYFVGNGDHSFPSWTAQFRGSPNQALFAAELAASFPEASRVVLTGGSSGSVGAMLNYWQWVDAFSGTRVDLVSDSFALVFADGPEWRHAMHHAQLPPGCPTCGTDYRTLYGFNASLAPDARLAVLDSAENWTLDLLTGYRYTQALAALQQSLSQIPNVRYHVADGDVHLLMQYPLDSILVDVQTQSGTHTLSDFLGEMQSDDPAWSSHSPL